LVIFTLLIWHVLWPFGSKIYYDWHLLVKKWWQYTMLFCQHTWHTVSVELTCLCS